MFSIKRILFVFGLLAAALATTAASADEAHAQGLFGVGEMTAGERGAGGFGLSAHFELGMMVEQTALGNWLGIELATELGYDKYADGEFLFDASVGFPITLGQIGNGGPGTTLFAFALGAGMSVQHVYGYVRGRILTQLSPSAYIELMGRWTPSEASNTWDEDAIGLDIFHVRASVFFAASDDLDLQIFAEWAPADITREGVEDPANIDQFPEGVSRDYQNIIRVGFGFVF